MSKELMVITGWSAASAFFLLIFWITIKIAGFMIRAVIWLLFCIAGAILTLRHNQTREEYERRRQNQSGGY